MALILQEGAAAVATETSVSPRKYGLGWHFIAISVIALVLRFLAVATHYEAPRNDSADYHRLAENVVQGNGYGFSSGHLSAFRVCGYPLFLAAIYAIAGVKWYVAEYVQAILGCATVLLIAGFGWLVVGRREGLLAGYLAAIYPGFVWLPRLLLSENLSLCLQLAGLCMTVLLLRGPRGIIAAGLGVVLGLNLLTRGGSIFLVALMIAGLMARACEQPMKRQRFAAVAVTLVALAMTLSPWVIRNYVVFGHFVPIATEDGITVYISYWPVRENGKTIWGNVPGEDDPVVAAAYRIGNEALMARHLKRVALARLWEQPARVIRLMPAKLINLVVPLDWEIIPASVNETRSINYGYILAIVPALVGAGSLWRHGPRYQWVLWAPPVAALLLAVTFYGSPRFRLPAEVSLLIFVSTGLLWIQDRMFAGTRNGVEALSRDMRQVRSGDEIG